jgi:hypothetical protein
MGPAKARKLFVNWVGRGAILSVLAIAISSLLLLAGCGGGGGPSAGTAGAASLIATDDLNTGYDHVWVTVKSINLVSTTGTTNVYTNSGGQAVDLLTLHDASGNRFLFLNTSAIPAGTYTGATVVVDNNVNIFPAGATTATAANFQTSGDFTMSLTFKTPKVSHGFRDNIVVDFNLANWVLTGTTVTAPNGFLSEGPTANLGDGTRWESAPYTGSVNNLTGAPGSQTFTLGTGAGAPTVNVSATTALYNSDGSANPTLANAENVIVRGTYDATQNILTATNIKILIATPPVTQAVSGAVSNVDTTADTFTITPHDCDRYIPTQSTLTVNVTANTTYHGAAGTVYTVTDFFTALQNGMKVIVTGSVSAGVVTATDIAILGGTSDSGGDGHGGGSANLARVSGVSGSLDATAGTFTVTKQFWEGFFGQLTATVTVAFNSSTVWSLDGTTITAAAAASDIGMNVTVRGAYDPTTKQITAVKVEFHSQAVGD